MSNNYNDLWNNFLYGERLNEGKKGKKKSKKPRPPNMGRMDKYNDKKKGGGRKFAKDFQDLLAVETLDDFIKQYQKMFGDGRKNTNKKALETMVAKLKRGEEIEEDDMGSLKYFIKKAWEQVQLSEGKKQKRRQIFAKLADTFDRLRVAEQSPEATEPEDGGQAPGEEERGAEDTTALTGEDLKAAIENARNFDEFDDAYTAGLNASGKPREEIEALLNGYGDGWEELMALFEKGKTDPSDYTSQEMRDTYLRVSDLGLQNGTIKRKFFNIALAVAKRDDIIGSKAQQPQTQQATQDAPQPTRAEIDAEIDAIINAPKPEREPTRAEKLTMMKKNNPRVWRSWLDELINALKSGNKKESIKWYKALGGNPTGLIDLFGKIKSKNSKVQESKLTDAQKAIIHERIIQALTEINWKTATPEEKAAFKARAKARRKKRDAASAAKRADRAVTNVRTSPGDEISSDQEGVEFDQDQSVTNVQTGPGDKISSDQEGVNFNIRPQDIEDVTNKIKQLGDLLRQPLEPGKKEKRVSLVRQHLADLKDLGIPQKEYDRLARAAISKLKTPESTQDPEAAALDAMKSDTEEMMKNLELIVPNATPAENAEAHRAFLAGLGYEETAAGEAGTDSDELSPDLRSQSKLGPLAQIKNNIIKLRRKLLQKVRANEAEIQAYKDQIKRFEKDAETRGTEIPFASVKSHEERIAKLELENEKSKQAYKKEVEKAQAKINLRKQQKAAQAQEETPAAEEVPAFRASPPVRRRRASEIVNEEEDLDEAELEEKKKRKKRRKRKRKAYGYGGGYMFDTDGDGGGDGGGGE